MNTFIYVLKPVERLQAAANWTGADNEIVEQHFSYLQTLLLNNRLILAGKTDGLDENTFGIVIFKCDDIAEAGSVKDNDPAVAKGIMTAELYPYSIALSPFKTLLEQS